MERWVHKHNPKNIPEIELVTSEGHSVEWRGGSPQTYTVDGDELSGFGQGVPQAVTDALRLGELNISGQHDRPFLLFDTPGEVARTLNRVVRLDVIDRTLANVAAERRKNGQEIQAQETRLKELQTQEAGFPDLETAGAELERLEGLEMEAGEKMTKAAGLGVIQGNLESLRAGLASLRTPEGMAEALDWLLARQRELEAKGSRLAGLEIIQGNLSGLYVQGRLLAQGLAQEGRISNLLSKRTKLDSISSKLSGLKSIQENLTSLGIRATYLSKGLAQDRWISELLTKRAHLDAKRRHLVRLAELNRQVAEIRMAVETKRSIINKMKGQIKFEFGDQCPLCGQEIK